AASGTRRSAATSASDGGNGLHRAVDLLVAVRERDEHRLELRRRDVDAAVEEAAEQGAVGLGVRTLRVLEAAHRLVRPEQRQHRADALDRAERREALLEARALPLELLVDRRVAEAPEHGEPGGRRE